MITRYLKKALAAALAAALVIPQGAVAAFAAEASSSAAPVRASFTGVEVSDDFVALKLSSGVQYNSFLTQTPPRLVLELLDTKNDAKTRTTKGAGKYLAGVRTSQFQRTPRMITRVVLDLIKMAVYKIAADSRGLSIQLAGAGDDSPAAADSAPGEPAAAPAPAAASAPVSILPPAPAAASAPVSILPSAPVAAPAPIAASAPVAASAPAAAPAPAAMPAPVPVLPSAPAVEPVPAAPEEHAAPSRRTDAAAAFKRAGLKGRMSPELAAMVEAEDTTKTRIAIPDDTGDGEKTDRALGGRIFRDMMSRLPRDPVTLDFDNTNVRDVIKLLAVKAKINIIYGPDVTGTLTLHLTDVPFNEAFRTVISMMQLSTDQVGDNVMRVITPAALTAQRTSAAAITKVIPLNYAKAANVKATIDSVRAAEGRSGSSSVDAATNSLIVTETLEGMLATENLISQLDQRPRQVLIEAKLVEVDLNNELDYGIQWNEFSVDPGQFAGKQGITTTGSTIGLNNPFTVPLTGNQLQSNVTTSGGVGAGGSGTGVSLAADRVFGALTLGRITNNSLINATITAAASDGKAKVLSDPKIATLNNEAANINVTTQIPYVTSNVASTGVQTQSVSYATTGIQLTVTPSINADGRILLVINPNVSQPSVTAAANTQTGAPAIDSRTAQTSVLVRDGETVVIGGLINDSIQDTISKIPLLGDIPIIGWLFKKKTKKRVRNELLIFVTTHVMPD